MVHIAAQTANLSHTSATLNIVSLAVSSVIRSAKQRALSRTTHLNTGNAMWFLFQIAIMTLIIERMAAA